MQDPSAVVQANRQHHTMATAGIAGGAVAGTMTGVAAEVMAGIGAAATAQVLATL